MDNPTNTKTDNWVFVGALRLPTARVLIADPSCLLLKAGDDHPEVSEQDLRLLAWSASFINLPLQGHERADVIAEHEVAGMVIYHGEDCTGDVFMSENGTGHVKSIKIEFRDDERLRGFAHESIDRTEREPQSYGHLYVGIYGGAHYWGGRDRQTLEAEMQEAFPGVEIGCVSEPEYLYEIIEHDSRGHRLDQIEDQVSVDTIKAWLDARTTTGDSK